MRLLAGHNLANAGGQLIRGHGLLGDAIGAAFQVIFTGLTNGVAQIGTTIGYNAEVGDAVKWSASSDPGAAATFGTGANPTSFVSADGFRLYLHVTRDGETVTRSALVRYAFGTAPTIAAQAWTVDDTSVNIDAAASGANLTFTYALSGSTAGVTIDPDTGAITGTPVDAGSGTATVTATDQYGFALTYTFTWSASPSVQPSGWVVSNGDGQATIVQFIAEPPPMILVANGDGQSTVSF